MPHSPPTDPDPEPAEGRSAAEERPGLARERARLLASALATPAEAAALMATQPRPAGGYSRTLGSILAREHKGFARSGQSSEQIGERWAEIVGDKLAALSEPVALRRRKNGGATLVIRAQGAAATFVEHHKGSIAGKAARVLGVAGMLEVKVEQGVLARRGPPAPSASARGAQAAWRRQLARPSASLDDALAAMDEALAAMESPGGER